MSTEAVGDEYAKSPLLGDFVKEFDITDKLFYHVWKDLIDASRGIEKAERKEAEQTEQKTKMNNPFDKPTTANQTNWKT